MSGDTKPFVNVAVVGEREVGVVVPREEVDPYGDYVGIGQIADYLEMRPGTYRAGLVSTTVFKISMKSLNIL